MTGALLACAPSTPPPNAKAEPAKAEPAKAEPGKAESAKPELTKTDAADAKASANAVAKVEPPAPSPTITEPTTAVLPADVVPPPEPVAASAGEVPTKPWSSVPHTVAWTEVTAPAPRLVLEQKVFAGVVGRAGTTWYQADAAGALVALEMDPAPTDDIEGRWPDDAWMVQTRTKTEHDFDYLEMRLMKLRGGKRWVPQTYGSNEQWFHPGTGMSDTGLTEYDEPHASPRSGMLMYPGTLEGITRVAGRHEDPLFGEHRGRAVDFFETNGGKVYTVSVADGTYYVQIQCDDLACVDANVRALPNGGWRFGRRVARGKHSITALAKSGDADYLLHHRGKSDGWLLETLPVGEVPTSMWDSEEGGLWSIAGERLRWRDTESAWHDVALPEGLAEPTVAMSSDRKTVWIAGVQGSTGKVFTAPANAAAK
jgi:hypothetical protein